MFSVVVLRSGGNSRMRINLWNDWREAWLSILQLLLRGAPAALGGVLAGGIVGNLFSSQGSGIDLIKVFYFIIEEFLFLVLTPILSVLYFGLASLYVFIDRSRERLIDYSSNQSPVTINFKKFLSYSRPVHLHSTLVAMLLGSLTLGPDVLLSTLSRSSENDLLFVSAFFLVAALMLDVWRNKLIIARRFIWLFLPFLPTVKVKPVEDFPWFVEEVVR